MAVQAKAGSFLSGTGTGTVSVTGVGFTPKAVIMWGVRVGSALDAGAASVVFGAGFGMPTTAIRRAASLNREDGSTTGATIAHTAYDFGLYKNGVLEGALALTSMDADGFTLSRAVSFSLDCVVNYLALGGADLEAYRGSFEKVGTTGVQAVTGVGFQPDAIILLGVGANPGPQTEPVYLIAGAGTGPGECAVAHFHSRNVQPHPSRSYFRSGEIWARAASFSDTTIARAELASMDANGFTLNWLQNDGAGLQPMGYLALRCPTSEFKVGTFNTATAPGSVVKTGLGFQPKALLVASAGTPESTAGGGAASGKFILGATTGPTASRSTWFEAVRDSNPVDAAQYQSDALYTRREGGTFTADGEAELASFDVDGFTLEQTDGDAASNAVWFLAIGEAGAGGGAQTVNALSASVGLAAGTPSVTPGEVSIVAQAATLALSAGAPGVSAGSVSVAAQAATLGLVAGMASVTPGPVQVSATASTLELLPGSFSVVSGPLISAQSVSLSLAASTPSISVGGVSIQGASAALGISVGSASVAPGPVQVATTSAIFSLVAGSLSITQGGAVVQTPSVELVLSAGSASAIPGPVSVATVSASLGLISGNYGVYVGEAPPVTPPIGVSATYDNPPSIVAFGVTAISVVNSPPPDSSGPPQPPSMVAVYDVV